MTLEQKQRLEKIRDDIQNAHQLFSDDKDAQHAYLDMAEAAIVMSLLRIS